MIEDLNRHLLTGQEATIERMNSCPSKRNLLSIYIIKKKIYIYILTAMCL